VEALSETLTQSVSDAVESHGRARHSTNTGTRRAVDELTERHEHLEQVVRELTGEVQRLSADLKRATDQLRQPSSRYSINHHYSEDDAPYSVF
jgi:predicted RNase H-like nuclease (RuvC/YqgF family)